MKGATVVSLREINVVVESVGMPEIVVTGGDASVTIRDYFGDSL